MNYILKANRLYFIDSVRAFAILMMLQGHFISTMLAPIYRNPSSFWYTVWSYFRGNTAPVFFTVSGLIFVYLLLKANDKGDDNPRIKKGLKRGLEIITIGYVLRIPFFAWLTGYFDTYFLVVDVLQCIGLSLILLIFLYVVVKKNRLMLSIFLLILGCSIFVSEPLYRNLTLENVPEIFENYLSKENGSVFTILPWFGFIAFGGFIATLFYKYANKPKFKPVTITLFMVSGILLMFVSTLVLELLYTLTNITLFYDSSKYNYLFFRLGNVLVIFGVFYALERFLKHPLILKIGKKTLAIYIVHFIILYGSFFGLGLNRFYKDSLTPWQSIIGAILFTFGVCLIVFSLEHVKTFVHKTNAKLLNFIKKSS